MAVTATPRFALPQWGAGTDPFTRAQMNAAFAALEASGARYGKGTITARPAASAANEGLLYVVTSATGGGVVGSMYFCDGAAWIYLNPRTIRIPHTFTISGDVKVPVGDTDYVPPFFVPVPAGQSVAYAQVRSRVNAGGSVTATLQKRAAVGGGVTAINTGFVTSTTSVTASTGSGTAFADGDALELVVTAATSSPKNMTASVFLDYTF